MECGALQRPKKRQPNLNVAVTECAIGPSYQRNLFLQVNLDQSVYWVVVRIVIIGSRAELKAICLDAKNILCKALNTCAMFLVEKDIVEVLGGSLLVSGDRVIVGVESVWVALIGDRLVDLEVRQERIELARVFLDIEVAGQDYEFIGRDFGIVDVRPPVFHVAGSDLGGFAVCTTFIIALHMCSVDMQIGAFVVQDHLGKSLVG